MKILNFISIFFIPLILFVIVLYAVLQNKPVFDLFTKGAKDGLSTVWNILNPLANALHIPTPLLPLSLLKLFSASGANGLLFDLFKSYGTDSYIGFSASILLSCTETLFYTISVYYMSIRIKKTRWTIPAGFILAFFSLLVSCMLAGYFLPS